MRIIFHYKRYRDKIVSSLCRLAGLNIAKRADYYSTLPMWDQLKQNRKRWDRPSALGGLHLDIDGMKSLLLQLHSQWGKEFGLEAGEYEANCDRGFGPGYPRFDARTLYYLLREWKPRRYLEIGSGLSTYYASLAAKKNAEDGSELKIECVEPYPFESLNRVPGIEVTQDFAQNIPIETFRKLQADDVIFIDSSHALKIDSDVAWLLLEVLPHLNPGVYVHIHDVPFPYNTPFPANTWIFGETWPVYWNEAMAVQAFLAFNSSFEIVLSAPFLRYSDESFLISNFSDYLPIARDVNPFSSLWIRKVK